MKQDSPTRLITFAEAIKRTCRSRWTLREEWQAGRFPKPIVLGHRSTMFVEAEIEAWIQDKMAKRDAV